jgi:hypothetical protein
MTPYIFTFLKSTQAFNLFLSYTVEHLSYHIITQVNEIWILEFPVQAVEVAHVIFGL